jgi:hypothetical protein
MEKITWGASEYVRFKDILVEQMQDDGMSIKCNTCDMRNKYKIFDGKPERK